MHLSIGFGAERTIRIVIVSLLGVLLVGASACLGALAGMIVGSIISAFEGGGIGPLPFVLSVGAALAALVSIVLLLAFVGRHDAWLEGTRLTVRSLRTRSVDLAAARSVTLETTNVRLAGGQPGVRGYQNPMVPRLVVDDGATTLRMRLASRQRVMLPEHEMRALADALSTSRAAGAADVVGWLRGSRV